MQFRIHFCRWRGCVGLIFLPFIIHAQLTIELTSVPTSTPPGSTIYIAGNFNSWNPGNPAYALTDHQNGTYSITMTPNPGLLEYKFTRGSWETVEGSAQGGFIPNRTYNYTGGSENVEVTIAGWEDNSGSHTAADNVQIYDEDFYIPQLNRNRRLWLYLPPDYHTTSKRYPVIYMHDGQNLFDAFYSFAGEWEVDESLNTLFDQGDYGAIVVGIDNGGTERFDEYCPWVHPTYGGGDGEAYVAFLVNTLKPHIDSTFRTLPEREYTAIAGSSMGGLISMYAIAEYPEVYSKAGIFSPAFWVADSAFIHVMAQTFTHQFRTYFIASENESASMIPNMIDMRDLLLAEGIEPQNLNLVNETDGAHSEWFWAREFSDVYRWLFEGLTLSQEKPIQKKTDLYPNPAGDVITIGNQGYPISYAIMTLSGHRVRSGSLPEPSISLLGLTSGLYVLIIHSPRNEPSRQLFVKL